MIFPLIYVQELHGILKNSIVYFEEGGHSDSELAIENRIIQV